MDESDIESLYSHFIGKVRNHVTSFVSDKYNGTVAMRLHGSRSNYFILELRFNDKKLLLISDNLKMHHPKQVDKGDEMVFLSGTSKKVQNAIYEFIGRCVDHKDNEHDELIKFDNKEKLFAYFNTFPNNKRYSKYYHTFCNSVVKARGIEFNCNQIQNANSRRITKGSISTIPALFAPQYDQAIFNKSISTTDLPPIETIRSFTPQKNITTSGDTSGNNTNSATTIIIAVILPTALIIILAFFVYKYFSQRKNANTDGVIRTMKQLEALGEEEDLSTSNGESRLSSIAESEESESQSTSSEESESSTDDEQQEIKSQDVVSISNIQGRFLGVIKI